jgi:hypothetical protein
MLDGMSLQSVCQGVRPGADGGERLSAERVAHCESWSFLSNPGGNGPVLLMKYAHDVTVACCFAKGKV